MNIKKGKLNLIYLWWGFFVILYVLLYCSISKFLFYSEVFTYNLMSCKWLALSLCIFCIYIFVFKVHSNFSGKICIHSYHVFFRDGNNWSQTKVHNRILIQNHFTHIIYGSCSLPVIGIPCKNLPCKMETRLFKVSSIGKCSVIWRVWRKPDSGSVLGI